MAGKTLEERARELADAIPIREGADRNEDVYRPILAALRDAVAEAREPLDAEIARLKPSADLHTVRTGMPVSIRCAHCNEVYPPYAPNVAEHIARCRGKAP